VAAAIANAILDANGARVGRLPFSPDAGEGGVELKIRRARGG
jgi:hypothetical protein